MAYAKGIIMYKLIIVDDEPYIVQLIEKLIDYDRLHIQLVGATSDPANALELIREYAPDILITDMRMPCMDGLALIEHINQSNLPISIIAISGYRRFDYAYNALKGGVEDYLVKPISRQELNNALEKVCRRLGNFQDERDFRLKMEEEAERNARQHRKQFILDSLANRAHADAISQIERDYSLHLVQGYYAGIAIRIDLPGPANHEAPLLQNCQKKIVELMGEICAEMEFVQIDELFCGLINTSAEATHQLLRRVKILFENLSLVLEPYEKGSISIGLGSIISECKQIPSSIAAARTSADVKCILGGNRIYYSEKLDWKNAKCQLLPVQIESLRKIMETGGADQLRHWLNSVFCKSASYYMEHAIEALSLIESVLHNFAMLCNMLGTLSDPSLKKIHHQRIHQGDNLTETVERLHDFMYQVVQADKNHRMQRDSYPIQCAKEYIVNNLNKPLALKEIAAHVMLNPNYLSKLFKDETGEGISDFILQLRLEEAKRLLRTTNLNISQIADCVGYQDSKHFSKLFRKAVGIQMRDYRNMYSR